jgi:hypothetical protein
MFNSFDNGFASGRWRDSEEFFCCCQLIIQHREKSKICHVFTVVAQINGAGEVNLPSLVDGNAGFRSATHYALTVARRAALTGNFKFADGWLETVESSLGNRSKIIQKVPRTIGSTLLHFFSHSCQKSWSSLARRAAASHCPHLWWRAFPRHQCASLAVGQPSTR